MPDSYDRQIGQLHDLPDVVKTKAAIVSHIPPMGVGGTETFVVRTFRQREKGDTIFLQAINNKGTVRLVIPPKVAAVIARQHESLTTMARKKAARSVAADRMAQGIVPGFMRKKGGK